MKWWLFFVICTVICWGCYVPTIHEGQRALGAGPDGKPNPRMGGLRAFICVGMAYFVTAVLIPMAVMAKAGVEPFSFNTKGTVVATLAGVLGALGALGIVFALKNDGRPIVVAPLVFAGAPIVNVFVAMAIHPPKQGISQVSPLFYVGLVMAAVGAGLVLANRPAAGPPKPAAATAQPADVSTPPGDAAPTPS